MTKSSSMQLAMKKRMNCLRWEQRIGGGELKDMAPFEDRKPGRSSFEEKEAAMWVPLPTRKQ